MSTNPKCIYLIGYYDIRNYYKLVSTALVKTILILKIYIYTVLQEEPGFFILFQVFQGF